MSGFFLCCTTTLFPNEYSHISLRRLQWFPALRSFGSPERGSGLNPAVSESGVRPSFNVGGSNHSSEAGFCANREARRHYAAPSLSSGPLRGPYGHLLPPRVGGRCAGRQMAESGEVIKFTYQVLDPEMAQTLNDKKNEPVLIDPQAGVKLVVPSLEKVGQLRQSSTPEAGRSYWMAFSNKGRHVKHGDRVNVVIGKFHADGLVVD
jgi:hypothetical protein